MTPEQLAGMSPEAKRIAIAQACGWTRPYPKLPNCWRPPVKHTLGWTANDGRPLPDYLNDLNAMHEAEKTLTDWQWTDYLDELHAVTFRCSAKGQSHQIVHATAAQRADAFLLTIEEVKS